MALSDILMRFTVITEKLMHRISICTPQIWMNTLIHAFLNLYKYNNPQNTIEKAKKNHLCHRGVECGRPGTARRVGCLCLSLTRINFLRFSLPSSVRRQAGQVTGIPAGHRRLVHGVSRGPGKLWEGVEIRSPPFYLWPLFFGIFFAFRFCQVRRWMMTLICGYCITCVTCIIWPLLPWPLFFFPLRFCLVRR